MTGNITVDIPTWTVKMEIV